MASCKDCLHYDVCGSITALIQRVIIAGDKANERCELFKPTADVVEVVKCKDCKHRGDFGCPMYREEDIEWDDDGYTECDIIIHDLTKDDYFCSYGERKENEAEEKLKECSKDA